MQRRHLAHFLNSSRLLAWLHHSFLRVLALWSTPRIGRVAICSPLVGVIAGVKRSASTVTPVYVQRYLRRLTRLPDATLK